MTPKEVNEQLQEWDKLPLYLEDDKHFGKLEKIATLYSRNNKYLCGYNGYDYVKSIYLETINEFVPTFINELKLDGIIDECQFNKIKDKMKNLNFKLETFPNNLDDLESKHCEYYLNVHKRR